MAEDFITIFNKTVHY